MIRDVCNIQTGCDSYCESTDNNLPVNSRASAKGSNMSDKVVIIGKSRPDVTDYTDGSWEVWGMNDMSHEESDITYTRWFELHRYEHIEAQFRWLLSKRLGEWYYRDIPVYTFEPSEFPEGPWTLRQIPYLKMAAEFPWPLNSYHCSSLDWMVAFALWEGFRTIHVVGVNNWSTIEPAAARPCLEMWLGYALGLGVTVHAEGFDLFKQFHTVRSTKPYGLDPSWVPIEDVDNPGILPKR